MHIVTKTTKDVPIQIYTTRNKYYDVFKNVYLEMEFLYIFFIPTSLESSNSKQDIVEVK